MSLGYDSRCNVNYAQPSAFGLSIHQTRPTTFTAPMMPTDHSVAESPSREDLEGAARAAWVSLLTLLAVIS